MPIFFIKDTLYFLTFLANLLFVGLLILLIFHRLVKQPSRLRRLLDWKMNWLEKWGVLIAFLIALFSTLASLFFSNVAGYPPCELCWFQRIFMYPLVFILGIALIRKERKLVIPYALVLSVIGLLIGLYQYFLQLAAMKNIAVDLLVPCSADLNAVSCSSFYDLAFGYITIPFMSFTAFLLIILFLLYARR